MALETIVDKQLNAMKNSTIAAIASSALGVLMYPYNISLANLAVPAATFGGLIYGLSLMETAKSTFGKLAATALTTAIAIPSAYLIYHTVPALLDGLIYAGSSIAAGAYSAALFPAAAAGFGLVLGIGFGYKIYKGVKNAYTGVKDMFKSIGNMFRRTPAPT